MTSYIVKRLLLFIPTLLGITFITFFLTQAVPGDPVLGMVGERADPATVERLRAEIGADRPFLLRYGGYLVLLAQGEMGRSYYSHRPVATDMAEKFSNTLRLALTAMLFSTIFGVSLGIVTALNRGTWIDRLGSALAVAGISLPVFWLGLVLMLIFAGRLHLFPPSGMGNGELIYLFLPAATLAVGSSAFIARITRSSMLEVLGQPYITTARAKGLGRGRVLAHALKNAFIPIITLIGLDLGSYLNGSVLTETIFGWDGLGRYALEGITKRDYPVIMGTVLFGAVIFVATNLVVDILGAVADPRVRHRTGEGD